MSMTWKKPFVAVAVAILFVISTTPTTAFAQEEGDPLGMGLGLAGTISTTTSPTTTTGGIVLLIVMLAGGSDSQLETYMQNNGTAMQHDLHLGGGQTTADLAAIFGVPAEYHNEFAEVLYENRNELTELAQPGHVDTESAQQFGEIVAEGILQQDALAAHFADELG